MRLSPKLREKAIALVVAAALLPLLASSINAYYIARDALRASMTSQLLLVTHDTMQRTEETRPDPGRPAHLEPDSG